MLEDLTWSHFFLIRTKCSSEMEKLQSFQNKFAKEIKLGKMSSSEALKCLNWLPLAGRRFPHRCTRIKYFSCILLIALTLQTLD